MPQLLTIGFAHCNDYDGAWATLQDIIGHSESLEDVEFVIVDNSPRRHTSDKEAGTDEKSPHAKRLLGLANQLHVSGIKTKYVRMPFESGTSYTRREIFNHGEGEFCLVLDCHVSIPTTHDRGIGRLLKFLRENRDSRDIYSGPLLRESQRALVGDHFDPVWRAEMLGVWSMTWALEDGTRFVCRRDPISGNVQFHDSVTRERIDIDIPSHGWEAHEPHVYKHGARLAMLRTEPYETPGSGLGLFCIRRDALPKFPDGLRGFGGEEIHLHEAVRMNGGRSICLPWLQWTHRFGYVNGVPYVLNKEDKFNNNLRWEKMLGLESRQMYGLGISDCVEHFREQIPATWESVCNSVMGGDNVACGCEKKVAAPPAEETIEAMYEKAKSEPSDINEHLEILYSLAAQCDTVVEFGVRSAVSTTALAHGVRKKLTSYDIHDSAQARVIAERSGGKFEFIIGSSLDVDIQPCDMLFVDTLHTADQVYGELKRHHEKVSRWIALHDTETFREFGEGDSTEARVPGLMPGIRRFLGEHPEWMVMTVRRNNNGMMVLTKNRDDMPKLPSKLEMGMNFAGAMIEFAKSGAKLASDATVEQRLLNCQVCEFRVMEGDKPRCSSCGCFLVKTPLGTAGRATISAMGCPIGKWGPEAQS